MNKVWAGLPWAAILIATGLMQACSSSRQQQNGGLAGAPPAALNIKEAQKLSYTYNPAYKLLYNVANTDTNLYVTIKFPEVSEQARLLKQGLAVFVNAQGKEKETWGIKYPNGVEFKPRKDDSQPEPFDKTNPQEVVSRLLENNNDVSLYDAENKEPFVTTRYSLRDIVVNMEQDSSGVLYYFLKVPLKTAGINKGKERVIALELKSSRQQNNLSRPADIYSTGNSMNRGTMGGSMNASNMGRSGTPMRNYVPPHSLKLWIKVALR